MFAFVLSALLCCAFFTGCSSTPALNNPNKTANNAPDYVNNFLQSDKYIGMSGDDLQAEGFILQDSVGTSSSSTYEKTISSVFVSIIPNTIFVFPISNAKIITIPFLLLFLTSF